MHRIASFQKSLDSIISTLFKKLLAKAPGGSSRLASYAAALFLLKEKYNLKDKQIEKIISESNLDVVDLISEQTSWYLLENQQLCPGVYRCKNEKVLSDTWDELVTEKDKIRVHDNAFPVGDVLGITIYEGEHISTGKTVHFTLGEIYR